MKTPTRQLVNVLFILAVFATSYSIYTRLYPKKHIAYTPSFLRTVLPTDVPKKAGIVAVPEMGAFIGVSVFDRNYMEIESLQQKLNRRFAIVGIYQSWGDSENAFDAEWAEKISNQGSIPMVTWEPWVPVLGYERSESSLDQKPYRLARIVDGDFDAYIRRYARDVSAYNKHIIIRFAHEMNGNWYPWGSTLNTPEEYVAAWKHVHDMFAEEAATNVTWLWSPNEIYKEEAVPHADTILDFYPGDLYVDWVGFSSFNWAGRYKNNVWRNPVDMYTETIDTLTTLPKPIIIAETASADDPSDFIGRRKSSWISSLASYAKNNDRVKGVIWFNVEDGGINWKLDSTASSEGTFNTAFDDYFIQRYEENAL